MEFIWSVLQRNVGCKPCDPFSAAKICSGFLCVIRSDFLFFVGDFPVKFKSSLYPMFIGVKPLEILSAYCTFIWIKLVNLFRKFWHRHRFWNILWKLSFLHFLHLNFYNGILRNHRIITVNWFVFGNIQNHHHFFGFHRVFLWFKVQLIKKSICRFLRVQCKKVAKRTALKIFSLFLNFIN